MNVSVVKICIRQLRSAFVSSSSSRLSAQFFGIFFFGQSDKVLSAVQRHQAVLRGEDGGR